MKQFILDESIESNLEIEKGYFPLQEDNYILNKIPEDKLQHLNYLTYLERCWRNHYNAVLKPNYIWHLLLSEIAGVVKDNSEKYRELFTDSDEKKNIIVQTTDPVVLPIKSIVNELKDLVPSDTTIFFPEFSTNDELSNLAYGSAFCDAMSPYYNYMMFMCGIPKMMVYGGKTDWILLKDNFIKICDLLKLDEYKNRVINVVDNIINIYDDNNPEYLKGIIKLTKCGSGSQYDVDGWITELFYKKIESTRSENYPSCVSQVEYKNISTNKSYVMKVGLFYSEMLDEYLVPNFSYVVYEK